MTTANNNDVAASVPCFDLDMQVETVNQGGGGGFRTAAEENGGVEVKRSTIAAKMPYTYGIGTLMKRLATIILPRNKRIAILPHTVSTYDKITDHEAVPADELGVTRYVFDMREWVTNRGTRKERKMIEFKFQVESPISVGQIKQAPQVMELLAKHQIYIFGRRYSPAVNTQPAGILFNLDPKNCSKNHLIADFTEAVSEETNIKTFIDLVPHRTSVRIGNKAIWGNFLKVMVEAEHVQTAAKVIQTGLLEKKFNFGLSNVRLMPLSPLRNMMTKETFGNMIMAHNKTMYDTAEVQVDNVWDIDTKKRLSNSVKEKLQLGEREGEVFVPNDELYTFREIILHVLWSQWEDEVCVTDVLLQRGKLMIQCKKEAVSEVANIVDQFLAFMKGNFDDSDEPAANLAEWVGCNNPTNPSRHPARSGTLVYGEERMLKATVDSFMDKNLASLAEGVIPVAGMAASKPDVTRPPRASLTNRSRRVTHVDPNEFHPTAVAAWTTAHSWAAAAAPKATRKGVKTAKTPGAKTQEAVAPKEVITVDEGTEVTGSMSSSTQAALNQMTESMARFEEAEKRNQQKMATLDASIAAIAQTVSKISDAHSKSDAEYLKLKESILTMTEKSSQVEEKLTTLEGNFADMKLILVAISQKLDSGASVHDNDMNSDDDEEMDSSIAGKRGSNEISASPVRPVRGAATISQSSMTLRSQMQEENGQPKSGATNPRNAIFDNQRNSAFLANSDGNNSPNGSETPGAGVQ